MLAPYAMHDRIVALRTAGHSIKKTAKLAGCSESQVKRVWAMAQQKKSNKSTIFFIKSLNNINNDTILN
ncbi:helix-turn-helix domain-containing protein [Bartonella sp. F02]|uniref:helix-turn-helix domain-containing protein n=1 Tax=Bartonella sp. F02 TaxID=2967262 RepID=UPI0022A9DD2F|nr:helix-turn-helix domain-containing protein [Bartonella sp. F02]